MNKSISGLIIILSFLFLSFTPDNPAYKLYDKNGKEVKYSKMISDLKKHQIVFIGELHDNPISHWMELQITKDLYDSTTQNLILGAEMFESDNQLVINEYLQKLFDDKKFEAELKLWKNYNTDYKPLMIFARDNNLHFIATNIPRRYANIVFKKGFDGLEGLSDEAKRYFAPLPINYDPEMKSYKDMLNMNDLPAGKAGKAAHAMANLPKAQAAKDATMAYFIDMNMEPGKIFIHYNGKYHSKDHEGIVWHLDKMNKGYKIVTVSTVLQSDISKLDEEYLGEADYIICVPEDMTRTY
jgi:uncharacterized iron-regulated protein